MNHTLSECRAFSLNPIHVRPSGELRLCWEAELDKSLIELRLKDILQAICYRNPFLFLTLLSYASPTIRLSHFECMSEVKALAWHIYLTTSRTTSSFLLEQAKANSMHSIERRRHAENNLIDLSLFSFY